MYNRYVRNDRGVYTRIPEDTQADRRETPPQAQSPTPPQTRPEASGPAPQAQDTTPRFKPETPPPGFRRINSPNNGLLPDLFHSFHLESMETGDLLLLILLFLLSHEQADEEVLAALAALLIL